MASSSSSLSSLLSSSGSSIAPVTFSGVSTFASDLQQVMSRAVAIAELPLKQIQNAQATVENKYQALQSLNPSVASVGADIAALGALGTAQSLSASSSNAALVSVTATGATAAANHIISNITSIASVASATSATFYADATTIPVSSSGTLSFLVGTTSYPITLATGQNNLQGLVAAITNSGAGVTASILTTQSGDYLSLSATSTGKLAALQLNDVPAAGPPVNLLSTTTAGLNLGSNADFTLDGITVSQSNNTINNIVSGLTFTILGTTSANQTVSLTLSQDSSKLVTPLQAFVNDYNALHSAVNSHVGQNGGALTGNSLLYQVESAMQQAVTYGANTGSIKSLADLGVSLDNAGVMTLDTTVLSAMTPSQVASAVQFLGSSSSGFGAIATTFTQISDPITGMIKLQEDSYKIQDQNLQTQVDSRTDQINAMQTNLQRRLEAADAAISALETQAQILTSSIQAVNLAMYGQNYGTKA